MEGTFLEALFSGRHALTKDDEGLIFIDRDPKFFATILNWLRKPSTQLPTDPEFKEEVEYFGLQHVMFPEH